MSETIEHKSWCKWQELPANGPVTCQCGAYERFHDAYEHGRGPDGAAHKATIRAEMTTAGCESFSDYVDYLRRKVNHAHHDDD